MATGTKTTGTFVAAAAAGLILSGCAGMGSGGGKMANADGVHCYGVNSCKGKTSCKSAKNDCKGKNSCKGQGWLKTSSKAECDEKGGTV